MCFNGVMTSSRPPVGSAVRVRNPETSGVVCETATVVDTPEFARYAATEVWVELRPSVRPRMEYDLASYPLTWVERTS